MTSKKLFRNNFIFVLVILIAVSLVFPVKGYAAAIPTPDVARIGSISVTMRDSKSKEVVPGGEFTMYKVAEAKSVGLDWSFEYTDDFAGCSSDLGADLDEKLADDIATYIKAKSIFDETLGDRIIIGSDTIVTKNGKIYGKPKNKEHAKEMIKELLEGNKVHSIMTGITILIQKGDKYKEYIDFDEIKVYLKNMTEKEIDNWIATGNAMDKAAAYGIQNEFAVFVDKIEGNYNSAVGLPIQKVYDVIKNYI